MVGNVGKVTETLKASLDWVNNNDWRSYVKYPGSTVIADPAVTVLDDQETIKSTDLPPAQPDRASSSILTSPWTSASPIPTNRPTTAANGPTPPTARR